MTAALDWQPTLAGQLLLLRPVRPDDWEEMFAAASDPLIWAGHPARDRYTEARFREYFDGAFASGAALTVVDRASGKIIGCSRYHDHNIAQRRVEIGFTFLVRACWGGSYNGELKRLMLDHAFHLVHTVQFAVAETNLRSRKAVEKIGGILTDARETRVIGGEAIPYCLYEIHRPDSGI